MLVYRYQALPHTHWGLRDTIEFPLPTIPLDNEYEFSIGLRIHRVFPYESVWFVVHQDFVNPTHLQTDTVCIHISDSCGRILGQGLNLRQYELSLPPTRLHKGQSGKIRLYHIMRCEDIPNVHNIGICIQKHTNPNSTPY